MQIYPALHLNRKRVNGIYVFFSAENPPIWMQSPLVGHFIHALSRTHCELHPSHVLVW